MWYVKYAQSIVGSLRFTNRGVNNTPHIKQICMAFGTSLKVYAFSNRMLCVYMAWMKPYGSYVAESDVTNLHSII